jgi:hypothetical protein
MADLRPDQATACTQLWRACVLRGNAWGRCGHERVAIAGRTLTAVKSQRRHCTPATRHARRPRLEAPLAPSRHAVDTADAAEAAPQTPTAAALHEQRRPRRARKGRDQGRRRARAGPGQRQVSVPDPDRRALPKRPHVAVGATVHVAGEATHPRCGVHEVTTAVTALDHLRGRAIPATAAWEGEQLPAVAAMGESHGAAINAGAEAGLASSGATPVPSATRP